MTRPRYVLSSVVLPLLAAFALSLALLMTAQADPLDGGAPTAAGAVDEDAGPSFDAGPYRTAAPPAVTAPAAEEPTTGAATAPAPSDPVAHPADALDGLRLWWHTGWAYGIAFAIGSLLVGLGTRITYLRTGWRAVVVGTLIAMVTAALAGKAAGLSDAQVVAAVLNLALLGAVWLMRRNQSTIDFSTATPEQIAAALEAAGKPPAFPTAPAGGS